MLNIHWSTILCVALSVFFIARAVRAEDDGSFCGIVNILVTGVLNLVAVLTVWLAYFIYW